MIHAALASRSACCYKTAFWTGGRLTCCFSGVKNSPAFTFREAVIKKKRLVVFPLFVFREIVPWNFMIPMVVSSFISPC